MRHAPLHVVHIRALCAVSLILAASSPLLAQSPLPLRQFTLTGFSAFGPVSSITERTYMFDKTLTGYKRRQVLTDDSMTFNREGQIVEERVKYEGVEKVHRKYGYTNGRPTSHEEVSKWGGLLFTSRYDFDYDSSGRLLEWREYDAETGPKEVREYRRYVYDAAGLLRRGEYWEARGVGREVFAYSYPAPGIISEYRHRTIHRRDGDTSTWGTYRTIYDSVGRIISVDDTSGIEGFQDPDRTEYRDGLPVAVTFYDADTIRSYSRYIYTFDSGGNWIRQRYESREAGEPESAWKPIWETEREITYYDK